MIANSINADTYKKLKYFTWFILLTIAVYLANSLFIFFKTRELSVNTLVSVQSEQVNIGKNRKARPFTSYTSIWNRNLFSVQVDNIKKPAPDKLISEIDKLTITSLNLLLKGTFINDNGESWAIIKDKKTGMQERYKKGAEINNAIVSMILRNKVVLKVNGKDELLVMGQEDPDTKRDRAPARPPRKISRPARSMSSYRIDQELFNKSINNITQIMADVRVKPVFIKGKPAGFRISRIKEGSLFKKMGFRNNDILQKINGQKIQSSDDMVRMYDNLRGNNNFSINILRRNRPTTLTINVR